MAIIRPFAALRPKEEYAQKVISPPYDVINRQEYLLRILASDNRESA
jgi:uncharacterized protein (DUF1015 family)